MKIKLKYRKMNNKDIALISGNISKLYEEGIPFSLIFTLLRELPLTKDYKSSIYSIEKIVQNGGTLEDAFRNSKELYSDFFSSIVGIGEKTGKITEVLKVLESYFSRLIVIKRVLVNAFTYPIILITSLFLLFLFMIIVLIPSFGDIYVSMGKEMPKFFLVLMNVNTAIINKPIVAIAYLLTWGCLCPLLLINKAFKYSITNIVTKLPLYKGFNEYIAILLISVVIRSGINLSSGLNYCSRVKFIDKSNDKFKQINKDIIKGRTLAEAMTKSMMFSQYTLAHIKLGEETGTLDNKVLLLEKELFDNIVIKINRVVENVQPIMIVIIGVVILSFILVFITPLFNALDAL